MVVNQSQVIFWENLKADGQVAKAVEKYKADNPNGQKCDTTTSNSGSNATTDQPAAQAAAPEWRRRAQPAAQGMAPPRH
jgi:hypothetical protein